MILTAEQKPVFRHIYIPGLCMVFFIVIQHVWGRSVEVYDDYGALRAVRTNFYELNQGLYPLFFVVCWGWDWLLAKDYKRLGLLAIAGFLHWLMVYPLNLFGKLSILAAQDGSGIWVQLLQPFLLSPIVWYAVARGLLEKNRNYILAGYCAGLVLSTIENVNLLQLPGLTTWLEHTRAVLQPLLPTNPGDAWYQLPGRMVIYAYYLLLPALTLYVYYLACHIAERRTPTVKELLGTGYYAHVGRLQFAMLYAAFYLVCFIITLLIADNTTKLLVGSFRGGVEQKGHLVSSIILSAAVLYVFFRLLRDLVVSRCITLRKPLGFMYYLCMVPVLNLVPYFYFISARDEDDEVAAIEYANRMNDPEAARHRFTIGWILFFTALPLISVLMINDHGSSDFTITVAAAFLQLLLTVIMLYKPAAKYWIIGLHAWALIYMATGNDEATGNTIYGAAYSLVATILAVNWYEKIFHPDVLLHVDYGFGGEAAEAAAPVKETPPPEDI